jgi:hypothetical protein
VADISAFSVTGMDVFRLNVLLEIWWLINFWNSSALIPCSLDILGNPSSSEFVSLHGLLPCVFSGVVSISLFSVLSCLKRIVIPFFSFWLIVHKLKNIRLVISNKARANCVKCLRCIVQRPEMNSKMFKIYPNLANIELQGTNFAGISISLGARRGSCRGLFLLLLRIFNLNQLFNGISIIFTHFVRGRKCA